MTRIRMVTDRKKRYVVRNASGAPDHAVPVSSDENGTNVTLTALRCGVCAEQAPLSTPEPVASAEIATFISAHAKHDRLAIEILIPTTTHVNKQFPRD